MKMEKGRCSSVLKGGCVWVTHTLNIRICISTQGWQEAKSMIDLVLVKDILQSVQDLRAVRGMGRGISDHHVVLCKVRLVGTWIKRREVVDRTRRIRNEKLRKHSYREEYLRSLEGKRVERDGESNV